MIPHEGQLKGAATNRRKAEERSRHVLDRVNAGASHAEIATELGVKVRTVSTIVLRARVRLSEPRGTSGVVRVGQLPAGPMADRRTKRNRSRSEIRRHAIEGES